MESHVLFFFFLNAGNTSQQICVTAFSESAEELYYNCNNTVQPVWRYLRMLRDLKLIKNMLLHPFVS